jgi:hypothetical protein
LRTASFQKSCCSRATTPMPSASGTSHLPSKPRRPVPTTAGPWGGALSGSMDSWG